MKTLLLSLLTLVLYQSVSLAQDYDCLSNESSPIVTACAPLVSRSINDNQETDYISDNISCIRVNRCSGICYISWNVCDDNTYSQFFIVRKEKENYFQVGTVKNIPSSIGTPLLYSTIDTVSPVNDVYYKFFKIEQLGTIKYIATIFSAAPMSMAEEIKTIPVKKND